MSHPPTVPFKPVGTFPPLGASWCVVTVMVTFTGGSMDSCAGSEPGVAGDEFSAYREWTLLKGKRDAWGHPRLFPADEGD